MKKADAIQVVVIALSLYCGMQFLFGIPPMIFYLKYWFSNGASGGDLMETIFLSIITLSAYLLMCIIGIKNSGRIASWAEEKAEADIPPVNINTRAALFITIIAIAIYGLITNLPVLLPKTYAYFRKEEGGGLIMMGTPKPSGVSLIIDLVEIGLFIVLLIYAHVFADMLQSRIASAAIEKNSEILGEN